MEKPHRGRIVAGAVLIFLGLVFMAQQLFGGFGDSFILFAIGFAFLAAYFYTRSYGLLIPGSIMAGLAFGTIGAETAFAIGDFSQVGLGLGFVAIFLIHLAYTGSSHWWPLIPGGILIVTGLAQDSEAIGNLMRVGWPLVLVLIGLLILAGSFGLTGRRKSGGDEPEPR